ncbi:MAG: hypothetical protein ABI193_04670 [Minicystis sp.]
MKDQNDKPAIRNGAAPQVFVPGVGIPDSRRGGVTVPDKAPARTTSPAGTPMRKTPSGITGSHATPGSERPPPGAQNTASTPRTVGGQTARLKIPELDEPDESVTSPVSTKPARPGAPRRAPIADDAPTTVKTSERRGPSAGKRDGLDLLPPLRPPPPRLPRPAPAARPLGLDDPGAFLPLLHEHEEPPEPRQTPTVRAVPSALNHRTAEEEERARERSAREASLVRAQIEAQAQDEDALRAEQRRAEQHYNEQLAAEKQSEARMREERRKEARLREEQLREQARDAAPKPKLARPAHGDDPLSPPLYGPIAEPAGNEAPEARWTFAVAIGCVSLALGALLPLPFRKHIVRDRGEPTGAASASAPAAASAAPQASTAAAKPAQTGDAATLRPAGTGALTGGAAPWSTGIAAPPLTAPVTPPPATVRAPSTAKPVSTVRKPGDPHGDIF